MRSIGICNQDFEIHGRVRKADGSRCVRRSAFRDFLAGASDRKPVDAAPGWWWAGKGRKILERGEVVIAADVSDDFAAFPLVLRSKMTFKNPLFWGTGIGQSCIHDHQPEHQK